MVSVIGMAEAAAESQWIELIERRQGAHLHILRCLASAITFMDEWPHAIDLIPTWIWRLDAPWEGAMRLDHLRMQRLRIFQIQ